MPQDVVEEVKDKENGDDGDDGGDGKDNENQTKFDEGAVFGEKVYI